MKVLIVDDDAAITDSLRRGLSYEGFEIAIAHTGAAGLKAAQQQQPDVVLLDWELPDISGIDVLGRLRQTASVGVIMLTGHSAINDRIDGLDSGADDYVVKPCHLEELSARIRAVARRHGTRKPNKALQFAGLTLDPSAYEVTYNGVALNLAGKEFSILELFLLNPRQVISRDTFYERVWNYAFDGGNSIEVYISYLRRKLSKVGAPELVQTVRGAGYVLREPAA